MQQGLLDKPKGQAGPVGVLYCALDQLLKRTTLGLPYFCQEETESPGRG